MIEEIISEQSNDSLSKMFYFQMLLGNACFEKNSIKDNEGNTLTFEKIYEEYKNNKFGANDLPNVWLRKFHECLVDELKEVNEMLPWKHWSKAKIGEEVYSNYTQEERINMLKIELVDLWHFVMSSMICLGMGPNELFELYMAKNKVNLERQNKGYNTAYKNESDNLNIAQSI